MRKITLTFDNGPEPEVTPHVLDCLARHNVKATFFVFGRKAEMRHALVERTRAEGHWIGNHTYSHRVLGRLDAASAVHEIERAEQALSFLDPAVRLFRPVGSGELGTHLLQPAVIEKLVRDRYTCVLWNCVPGDWRDAKGWLERGIKDCRSRDWSLVVLHDVPNAVLAHLDEFLTRLEQEGCHFTQDFPPQCLPIVNGIVTQALDPYQTTL